MDTALIVITVFSVGLTGALLVYASKLQREQREREDARVVALTQEILIHPEPSTATEGEATEGPAAPGLFEFSPPRAPRAFAISAAGAALLGLVLGAVYVVSARPADRSRSAAPAAPAVSSLELVSLEQARSGQALTVRGVVRNPAGAEPRHGLAAVVFVFDRSGAFVTSSRAAIDDQKLEAGDESPFTVAVPNAAGAARYRVSFRTDRDVLPHVDRRGSPQASNAGQTKS